MAGHAYKAAVDELDTGVGRELVCHLVRAVNIRITADGIGCPFPDDCPGTCW